MIDNLYSFAPFFNNMNKHFLDLNNFSLQELEGVLSTASSLKNKQKDNILEGKFLGLIFEKSSTRTRVSFEVAMTQLGGRASFLSVRDLQLGRGEPVEDTAKVLSSMVDGLVLRTMSHSTQLEFAEHSESPVINGLSDRSHPCQILADILTYQEERGEIKGKKVAWCGDFNNVCFSYAQAAKIFGFELWVACPEQYMPREKSQFDNVIFTDSINEAVVNSAIVTTDVWVSMGDEEDENNRKLLFQNYQVNEALLDQASSEVIFLHCLPAIRGEEISKDLLNDPRSRVWAQAENRLHAQKGLLVNLLG
jgi:ornithine carbamoyltransferase